MYGKLFTSIFDGTLHGRFEATVTMMALIALADRDGIVDMTPQAIISRSGWPERIVLVGLAELSAPDPESRSSDEGGRRIVLLDEARAWGWRLVNYAHYRAIRTADERRAYQREYFRRKRSKAAVESQQSLNTTQQTQPTQPISEAYADANAEARGESADAPPPALNGVIQKGKKPKRGVLGHFAPEEWAVDPALADWAKQNHPGVDLYAETKKFRCHEFDKPKSDWSRAWQNWVRKADELRR